MREDIMAVSAEALVGEVARLKVLGYRLVTLSCTELDATTVDVLYHFDRDLELKHLRLTAPKSTPVPSISPVYFAALLVENEIQDFFGLRFDGLLVDYRGTLYLEEEALQTPFCRFSLRAAAPPADPAEQPESPLPPAPGEPAPDVMNS